jgi:hypothetical protein
VFHGARADYSLPFAFGINIARIQKIDARIKSPVEHMHTLFFRGGISKIIGAKA